MRAPEIRGVRRSEESAATRFRRDTRTFSQRMANASADPLIVGVLLIGLGVGGVFLPLIVHVAPLVLITLLLVHLPIRSHRHLPIRLPRSAGIRDINHPMPGRKAYSMAAGIVHVGNAIEEGNQELWLAKSDVLTHDLGLGVTGAGKTVNLVGIASNYIAMGGGLIFVDAKAAPSLPWDIYALLLRLGMEDDFLLVNYMTGNRSVGKAGGLRMTNTANPFASGSADSLVEIMSSLIPTPEGDNAVFGERALSMITAVLYGLVDLRDGGYIDLGVEAFRDYLPLTKVEELTFDPRLSGDTAKAALLAYMRSLPNWKPPAERQKIDPRTRQPTGQTDPIHDEANRQHGFAQMYFTRSLSSLTDTYGHIYRGSLGEVDYVDVVRRRRALVVLLPALEKSLAGLANLGKINLSALKDAISTGLGGKIEGSRRDVLETLPTVSPIPSKVILDEYGYMAVEGMSVVAAQARGLGFSVTFAGQDWAGIKRGSEIEASQIWGNTNFKWFGKLQDQESYGKLAEAVGEAQITQSAGFSLEGGGLLGYADNLAASIERKARTDTTDLQSQIEGEAHLIYGGKLIRARMYYANPTPVPEIQVNRFLRVGEKLANAQEGAATDGTAKGPALQPQSAAPKPTAQEAPPPARTPPAVPALPPVQAQGQEERQSVFLPPELPAPPQPALPQAASAAAAEGSQESPPHRRLRDVWAAMEGEDDADEGALTEPPAQMGEDASSEDTDGEEYSREGVTQNVARLLDQIDNPEATAAAVREAAASTAQGLDDGLPAWDAPTGPWLSDTFDAESERLAEAVRAATDAYPTDAVLQQAGDLTPDAVAADLRDLLNLLLQGDDGDGADAGDDLVF